MSMRKRRPKRIKVLNHEQVKALLDSLVKEHGVATFLSTGDDTYYLEEEGLHHAEVDFDYGDDDGYCHYYRLYKDYTRFAIRDDGAILFIKDEVNPTGKRRRSWSDRFYPVRLIKTEELISICALRK